MTLMDYNYAIGSSKHASDYSSVTYFILNHLSKTLNQGHVLVEALEKGQPIDPDTWKPTMAKSEVTTSGSITTAVSNWADEIEYQAQLELWLKNKELYKTNVAKAYATIWEQCNTAMKNKILQKSNYENKIKNSPFKLLEAVKVHSVTYSETRFPLVSITEAYRSMLNIKQGENNSLIDYV